VRAVAVVVALALALTGCSFFLTHGPSSPPPAATPTPYPPECTTSMAFPIVDGLIGAIGWLAVVGAVSKSEMTNSNEDVVAPVIIAGAFTVAAIVGYTRVRRCNAAREQFMAQYPYGQGYAPPQPQPQPTATPQPAAPPAEPAPPAARPPASNPLGTEGDVCNSVSDCASGLVCQSNVCLKPKPP
jgi:hypothetical protein